MSYKSPYGRIVPPELFPFALGVCVGFISGALTVAVLVFGLHLWSWH